MTVLVIPGRGRRPASLQSITANYSMTHRCQTHHAFAFMDSALAADFWSARPGMTRGGG